MNVLFVAPVEIGSGETITALHMAERVLAMGGGPHPGLDNQAAQLEQIQRTLSEQETRLSQDQSGPQESA